MLFFFTGHLRITEYLVLVYILLIFDTLDIFELAYGRGQTAAVTSSVLGNLRLRPPFSGDPAGGWGLVKTKLDRKPKILSLSQDRVEKNA